MVIMNLRRLVFPLKIMHLATWMLSLLMIRLQQCVTKLSALYRRNKVSGSFKMCNTCLATFHNVQPYLNHLPCHADRYIQTENMPDDDLEFKEFHKCVDLSDIVYADME